MVFNSRRNERYEFLDQKVEADLINGNEVGLCMLSPHRLAVGQEITIKNFMNFSSRTAGVIWIAEGEQISGSDESDKK